MSFGIHMVIFMHISGVYNSKALSYIELTIQNMSKPSTRAIPRPRQRFKPPQPQEVKRLKVTPQRAPRLKPVKLEAAEKHLPDSLVERIDLPDIPDSALKIADWSPGTAVTSGHYTTVQSYLEMVRLKIERYKKYPDVARVKNIEGLVVVRFIITPDGGVREVKVIQYSRNPALDLAALRAVKDAAPFPKPPKRLFKGEIPLELMIVFELT